MLIRRYALLAVCVPLILCACSNPFYPVYLGNGGGRGDNSGGLAMPIQTTAGLYELNAGGTEWDLVTGSPLTYPIESLWFFSQVNAYLTSNSGEYLMLVDTALTTNTNMNVGQDRKLTIQSTVGGPYTISFTGTNNFIDVANGALILKDITLVGNSLNQSALVKVSGAPYTKLTMYSGSAITNNTNVVGNGGDGRGGGVSVVGSAVFELAGGRIYNNTAHTGGGVYVVGGGRFTMSNSASLIENNTVTTYSGSANGGGVYVESVFRMEGGMIRNNDANPLGAFPPSSGRGGGVYVADGGFFTKTAGGYIYGTDVLDTPNTANNNQGDAVYIGSSPFKYRNSTADHTQTLNSADAPGTNGWE